MNARRGGTSKSGWCMDRLHELCRIKDKCPCDCPVDIHGSNPVNFSARQPIDTTTEGQVMAQKVQVLLTDDLDGSEATETIGFGLDGQSYEIDLSEKNAAKFRKAFTAYLPVARKVKSGTRPSRARGNSHGPNPRDVREWAAKNKIEVPARGRIPAEVTAKFEAANK